MSEPMRYPGVGTGVWIRKEGKVLLGLRESALGTGTWCIPGGKLELFERWEDNARREVKEETGLDVGSLRFAAVLNDPDPDSGTHYASLHFVADWVGGEPRPESGKLRGWQWYEWGKLPEPLFPPTGNFIKSGYNPFNF